MNNYKKIILIILLIFLFFLFINNFDKNLRYGLSLGQYNKYNQPYTTGEIKRIKQKDILVGIYDYPPFIYTNEFNNRNTGIMIDYLSQLAIELSSDIHTKLIDADHLLNELRFRKVDMIVYERYQNEEINPDITLTQDLVTSKIKILVNKNSEIYNIQDLNDKAIVMLRKSNLDEQVTNFFNDKININLIEVDNVYEAFALLNKGEVSGIVGDNIVISRFINVTNKSSNYYFLNTVISEKSLSIAVRKEDEELLTLLNKGILQLKKKNLINQTQYKWIGNDSSDTFDFKTIKIIYNFMMGLLIIIVLFASWNYNITKKVNDKTKELSESKEELKLIIETMNDGLVVIENGYKIIELNNSMAKILNLDKSNLKNNYLENIKEIEPFVDVNNMNKICNINDSYYYITCQKITDNKKMIVVEDYTDKYLKEKTERQESKMIAIGQLSAGLAHEIRNPLGLIKNYTYIIENQSQAVVNQKAISVIYDSISRINNLIENLLRFSKFSNENAELINIKEYINKLVNINKSRPKKIPKINLDFSNTIELERYINTEALKIVLINLIDNSIESFNDIDNPENEINIKIGTTNKYIEIIVSDNGSGIEKEKIDKIFNPFFSTKDSGTGLGLYIVSTEVTNNNGKIKVDSKEGKGTTFEVRLPIWSD